MFTFPIGLSILVLETGIQVASHYLVAYLVRSWSPGLGIFVTLLFRCCPLKIAVIAVNLM